MFIHTRQVTEALGIPRRSIDRILQGKPVQELVAEVNQSAIAAKPTPSRAKADSFDLTLIGNAIHHMYRKKQPVTMPRVQRELASRGMEVNVRTLRR